MRVISESTATFYRDSAVRGEDTMSDEITITITRQKAFVMCKTPATLVMDGAEIGKLKNGESIQFKTTAGKHDFEAKALTALSGNKIMDLGDGDTIAIKMVVAGWVVTHEKKSRFSNVALTRRYGRSLYHWMIIPIS